MESKVFCPNCRCDVDYVVEEKEMTGKLKERDYNYRGKEAVCCQCGAFLHIPEIVDSNIEALRDAYRTENDLVSLAHIREIPDHYQIGKRPLSLLLGWGEQTFSRYYDGDMPSKQYSDVLKQLRIDPQFYLEILEKNKNQIKEISYKKSKHATEALLKGQKVEQSKIELVIQYLLQQCEDITPLALQKALYYAQGFYYAFYQHFLFADDCEAWIHGPVYREVYQNYRDYRFEAIDDVVPFDESLLTVSEKAVLDAVVRSLCCYSGKVLEQFTHSEFPWIRARRDLPCSQLSVDKISKDWIRSYFCDVKEKYKMLRPDDIESYARDLFSKF